MNAQALGPQAHLPGGLFSRDVERGQAPAREAVEHGEQQGGLADARVAAEQGQGARDEAAAEHPVQLTDAGA